MKKLLNFFAALFVALAIIDAVLTSWAVNNGCTELNPFVAPIAGSWVFIVVKVAIGIMVTAALLIFSRLTLSLRFLTGTVIVFATASSLEVILLGLNALTLLGYR